MMKLLTTLFFLAAFCHSALAFPFSISGKVLDWDMDSLKITLSSPAWHQQVELEIDRKGRFSFSSEEELPIQITLSFTKGATTTSSELYLFGKDKVKVEVSTSPTNTIKSTHANKTSNAVAQFMLQQPQKAREKLMAIDNPTDAVSGIYEQFLANNKMEGNPHLELLVKSYLFLCIPELMDYSVLGQLPLQDMLMHRFTHIVSLAAMDYIHKAETYIVNMAGDDDYMPTLSDFEQYEIANPLAKNLWEAVWARILLNESPPIPGNEQEFVRYASQFIENSNSRYNRFFEKEIEKILNPLLEKPMPAFVLQSNKNEKVSSDSFKGKYLLLDVWGSWCLPCRRANKKLVEYYEELQPTGNIEFLSVAFERNLDHWQQAITDDKLTWVQLLSTEEFLKDYQVNSYPTMYLISPEGIVLKRAHFISIEEILETINK